MDAALRVFFVRRRKMWRNRLLAWELRTTYRREKAKQGETVRPYHKHGLDNSVRSYAAST